MKGKWWIAGLVALALMALACAKQGSSDQYESKDKLQNLIATEVAAVKTEPDPTTSALLAANFQPFGVRFNNDQAIILYGPPGSQAQSGHGTMAQPWASRQLKKKPIEAKDWHTFKDTLVIVSGDDWPEARNIERPANLPYEDFQCTSKNVTANGLSQLAATINKHEPSRGFDVSVGGMLWGCRKTAAAKSSPSPSRRR